MSVALTWSTTNVNSVSFARPEVLSTVKEDFGGEDASSSSHLISSSATAQANRKGVNLFIIRFTFGLIDLG
jgi:hypothetical protein